MFQCTKKQAGITIIAASVVGVGTYFLLDYFTTEGVEQKSRSAVNPLIENFLYTPIRVMGSGVLTTFQNLIFNIWPRQIDQGQALSEAVENATGRFWPVNLINQTYQNVSQLPNITQFYFVSVSSPRYSLCQQIMGALGAAAFSAAAWAGGACLIHRYRNPSLPVQPEREDYRPLLENTPEQPIHQPMSQLQSYSSFVSSPHSSALQDPVSEEGHFQELSDSDPLNAEQKSSPSRASINSGRKLT